MAVRRTFDTPMSGDEEATGQEWSPGQHWDNTHFGGYGARSETAWDENGNPRQVQIGDSRGDYVNRYRGLGAAAADRKAYQLDYTAADQDRARGLQAREGQVEAAGQLSNAAHGNAPSRAAIMSQGGLDTGMHAQLNAGGKGLAQAAYAQRMGLQQAQQGQLGAISQSAGMRADELGTAQDAYMRGASNVRDGDYRSQYQMQKQAQAQMQMELEQRQRNQQQQQAYEKLAFGVNQAEMNAELAKRQGYLARDAANQQAANSARAQSDDMVGTTINSTAAGGSAAFRAGGGGGGGAPTGGSWGDQSPGGSSDDKWTRDRDTALSDMRGKEQMHILSDDRTKLASAWDQGHASAIADVEKASRMDPDELKKREGTPAVDAARSIKMRAWDEGANETRPLAAARGRREATESLSAAIDRKAQIDAHRMVPAHGGSRLAAAAAAMRQPGTPEYAQAEANAAAIARAQAATQRAAGAGDITVPRRDDIMDRFSDLAGESLGRTEDAAARMTSDERAKGDVLALYEPPGKQLHMGDDGRAMYADERDDRPTGASLSGIAPTYSKARQAEAAPKPTPAAAPAPKKRMTNEEMLAEADRILAKSRAEHEARMAAGPAVKDREQDQSNIGAQLENGLKPYTYEYKPGFREQEGQQPGEKNVGPMAQNMAANPITGSAVEQGDDGLLRLSMPKSVKLSLGGIGYLASQQRAQEERLRRLEKGRG